MIEAIITNMVGLQNMAILLLWSMVLNAVLAGFCILLMFRAAHAAEAQSADEADAEGTTDPAE